MTQVYRCVVSIVYLLPNNFCYLLAYLPPTNEVWGKVIFSVACIKNSVHRGVSASVHTGIPHPPEQTPPPDQAPPSAVHAGRYGQQAGGMHPTGMQSCLDQILQA